MNKQVMDLLDAYREDYVATLSRWVRTPSIKGTPEDGAPFGRDVRRMLDLAMQDAQDMGFRTRIFDGYAGDTTLGPEDQEMIAVLGHLDVVPVGDGWTREPFGAAVEDGKMYGRGTIDDKGPALAAMFAMKAIREAGIPLHRSIRLILGCDEESDWQDMDYYCKHAEMPALGFSPDASFPLINTEKGMLHMFVHAPLSTEGVQVLEWVTGERMNVIPGEARAILAGDASLVNQVRAYAQATGLPYRAEMTDRGVCVTAEGIPGHAAYPEGRRNAIGMMLCLLRELGVQGPLRTLADVYGMETDGTSLGIACADEVSGALTCNMGILHIRDGNVYASFDCRVPISADLAALRKTALDKLSAFTIDECGTKEPHHVPAESELVSSLLGAYHDVTGLPAVAESTGGGTYAKVLRQGVAFGAAFPDDEDLCHQANEFVWIDKMILAAKVYAEALLRLCAQE